MKLKPEEKEIMISEFLDPQIETQFSPAIQKKRRQLAEMLIFKRPNDVVINPAEKQYRGPQAGNSGRNRPHTSQPEFRGSQFRGISKNGGSSWQILIMINRQKKYLGSYQSQERAAKIYDQAVIQQQGHKAKTNFAYNRTELAEILKMASLV